MSSTSTNEANVQGHVDVGIVVALAEEFEELLAVVGSYTPQRDGDLRTYSFERGGYRCVVTLVGEMGESHATRVTDRLIERCDPASIVVIGIAGGVHEDLRVGDVYVPPQAVQYLQDAKAAKGKSRGGYTFKLGAPAFRADHDLMDAVRNFRFGDAGAYKRWVEEGRADLVGLIPSEATRDELFTKSLVRRDVLLRADGHVATGPVVGAAAAFSAWIRSFDRNVKALEMESAAVLLAAQSRRSTKRAIAIRGISDYGDERKQELDRLGEGSLRRYAMRNAVRLLFAMLDAGAWPREREVRSTTEPASHQVSIHRLPVPGKFLFGRDKELAALDACWSDPKKHVVSIVAMGGAGKSALVFRWLSRMQEAGWRGAERVYGWSFYSQGSSDTGSGDTFIAEALKWFGYAGEPPKSADARGELLAGLVKKQKTLLVLDGLEPLQTPPGLDEGRLRDPGVAALVRELAASGSGLCVITTRFAVADLAAREDGSAPTIDLNELSPEDGAKLLEALKVKGLNAELEDASREMKGHALGLTLLGSYLADACGGEVRKRKEIGPLESYESGGERAKRVMAAYARWLGDGPEVAVLRLLGLFDRPADDGCLRALRAEPAIPKLTETLVGLSDMKWNQKVAKLRHAHLVADVAESESGGIDAHPLVREHFGARLREEAPDAWRAGHGRLFEHLQKVAPEFPEDTVGMAPLYAAVVHGCHAGRHQEAFFEVFRKRVDRGQEGFNTDKLGAFGAHLGMLAAFFESPWTRVAAEFDDETEAFILNEAGYALLALGRLDEAAKLMQRGPEKYLARDDWNGAAIAFGNLSQLHLVRGAVEDAVEVAKQSVELGDRRGDAIQRSIDRVNLANALLQAGRVDEARAFFEEAEALQAEQQPEYPFLYTVRGFLYNDLLLGLGLIDYVSYRARLTIIWAMEQGVLLAIALDHLCLGRALLAQALRDRSTEFTPARTKLDEAVMPLRQAGQQDHLPRGLLARAELHIATCDFPAAEHDLNEALTIATRGGMRLFETDAHLGFARLHITRGDLPAARISFTTAKNLVGRTGYHRRDPDLAALEAALKAIPERAPERPACLQHPTQNDITPFPSAPDSAYRPAMDAEPLDPSLYVHPPVMTLETGISLCRALVSACPKGAPARVKKASTKLTAAADKAQAALGRRQKALGKISDEDARLIDQSGDGSWGGLRGRLQSYSMLPADEYPDATRAGQLVTVLFGPDGLNFLKEKYPVQWSTADTILKRITDEKLQKDIDRIAGEEFLDNIRKRHAEYGAMVQRLLTKTSGDAVNLSSEVRAIGRAVVAYATQVIAATDDDDNSPEAVALAHEALRPLDVIRDDASRGTSSTSTSGEPPAEAPAGAPPEA